MVLPCIHRRTTVSPAGDPGTARVDPFFGHIFLSRQK